MAADKLQLKVILSVLEKATAPLKRIQGGSIGAARALKEARDRLKDLNSQQKDIGAWRAQREAIEQTAQSIQGNRSRVRELSRELASHEQTIRPLQASYDALSSESTELAAKHKTLYQQLRQTREQARSANQVWQENRKRIRELGQQLANTAQPTKKLQDEYAALTAKQRDQLELVRRLSGEQKELQQQHRASATSTREQKTRLAELADQLREARAPMQALNQQFRAGVREGAQLKQQHHQQQVQLQGLRNKLNAAGISTRNLSQGERDLRAKISATNSALSQQESRLKRITAQQRRLAAAKSQYESAQGLAGSMAGTGAGGLATGSGILYAGAQMMAPGVQFDADMSKVQALTRLNKGDEQLAALRAQSRQLGAETMFSATDAAQGQGYLAMAGFNPKEIMAAMPGMLDMAKAGDTELAETADIAANILKGMNLPASDATRLGDVLVGTFTRANTNLALLGETMKYVGPVASSAGQGIETVAAMAGKLADDGIKGSMGGTALRAIIGRLSAPPKSAAKALDKLGISAKDAQGNLRDLPTVLKEISEKTKGMGNADRAGLLKGIAGEEAVAGLQTLVKYAGSGELQQFIGTLRQTQGEAAKVAKVMGDNLVGDLDELSSAWEDLGIQLQEQQNGPLREITQTLAGVIGGIKSWIVENPELAAQIVKTAAGIGILMAGMGGLTLAMASILGPFAMVRYGMMLFGIKGAGLAGTLFRLGKTALPLVATGLRLVAAAAIANPILAIVMGIALAATLIYANWDKIGPYFAGLWAEIKAGFSGGLGGIAATILNFSPLGLFHRALAGVLGYFGIDIPARFTDFGGMLIGGLVNGITAGLGKVKQAIVGAADSTIGWFKEKLGIHSPSRVFAALGGFTMAGLGQGLAGGERDVLRQIAGTAKRVAGAGADMLGRGAGLSFDSRPPISAGRSGAAVAAAGPVTINIYPAAGMDAATIGREVQRQLAAAQQQQQARQRGRLSDQD